MLSPLRVAYLDYTGSGAETIAHLRDNGRIVLMFCAFDGAPRIVRLHGAGRPVFPDDPDFAALRAQLGRNGEHGLRAIIDVNVSRVSASCGYAVPRMQLVAERDLLDQSMNRKTPDQLQTYRQRKNTSSIDGLPAVPIAD